VIGRYLASGARLAQAARTGQVTREPARGLPARTARTTFEPAPQAVSSAPPALAAEPARPSAAALAPRPGPVLPPELPQALAGGTILPGAAHLRLESSSLGDLALHLRIREGVAHLRVEGEQGPQLAQRSQELQRALAADGLKLGQLEVERPQSQSQVPAPADQAPSTADQGWSGGQPRGQQEPAEQGASPGATPSATGGATASAESSAGPRRPAGRTSAHHVEA